MSHTTDGRRVDRTHYARPDLPLNAFETSSSCSACAVSPVQCTDRLVGQMPEQTSYSESVALTTTSEHL
jgi:hypothetical protein